MYRKQQTELSQNERIQALLFGAVAGGLLGAGSALMFAPKEGKQFRQGLSSTYHGLADRATSFKDNLVQHGNDLMGKSKETSSNTAIILGGLAGGLILAGTAFYLMQRPESLNKIYDALSEKTEEFTDNLQESSQEIKAKAGCWMKNAINILDRIHNTLHDGEEKIEQTSANLSERINDVMDLANVGIRLFQKFSNRR